MSIEFLGEREIVIFVDEQKNIVIFPKSKSDGTGVDMIEGMYYPAYYPIELYYPYSSEELARKIQLGFEEWDKHECYGDSSGKNTYEEKYFGIKGFKNAVKGKRYFVVGWGCEYLGNTIRFQMPLKRGYAYIGLKRVKLDVNADYIDYAIELIKLIEMDINELDTYKTYKSKLNI